MAYKNDYKFVRKYNADGSKTKWYAIVSLLKDNGPMRKREILDVIWPNRYNEYYQEHTVDRGYCSSLFAQLNESGLVHYSSTTQCWYFDKEPDENSKLQKKSGNKNEYNSWGLRPACSGEWDGGTFGCGMYDRNGNYVDLWC